jgi:hypothetical protein
MPSETAARVLDSLFNEGPKIIFRVALALLKMHEELILRADNAGARCCCGRRLLRLRLLRLPRRPAARAVLAAPAGAASTARACMGGRRSVEEAWRRGDASGRVTPPVAPRAAGDVLVTVRQAAVHMHHRDRLMHVAFEELGSLPMSLIKNHREARQQVGRHSARRAAGRAAGPLQALAAANAGPAGRLGARQPRGADLP